VEECSMSTPLDQVTFTVLDVETTGLAPHFGDRICEIALLRCREGRELGRFSSLVNPGRPISPGASAVNGIGDDDLIDAPYFSEIAPSVMGLLKDSVLVAHNAPFDLAFLSVELEICRLPATINAVIDTLALARRCYRFPSNSLGSVAHFLGIEVRGQHRAMVDVLTTKMVLERFLADSSETGITMLGELLEAQGGSIRVPHRESIPLPPQIEEALKCGRKLLLCYVSASGEETQRTVTPLSVATSGGYIYLVAMCHLRHEQRSFRLDRIVEMNAVGDDLAE
jgi:DNA polymerase-3 subunit epsilon